MKKALLSTILALVLLWSCNESSNENAMKLEDRLALIEQLENESFGENGQFNKTKALGLVNNYADFATENPEDDRSASFLFKAGDISMGLENAELAISYFDRVIDNYPDYEKIPYCMFLKGFVFENSLKDMGKAEAAYSDFINEYPDHDMTEAAKFSLQNLGKSPEQLIREFEEQNVNQDES